MKAGPPRRRLELDEVSSTNTVALEAARAGDPGPLWITARRQVAGRGRRGRPWVSEAGNLYATYLLIDPAEPAHVANLPLVVSLGVRNGLARLLKDGEARVAVKWPNDVLIEGRKAVGILLESESVSGRRAVVVGCGVNVGFVPEGLPYPAASLGAAGGPTELRTVFEAVAAGVEDALARFRRGAGFAEIRAAWLGCAVGVGQPCRVNLSDRAIDGRFEAIDESGRLLLALPSGELTAISAGDLFFPDPGRETVAGSAEPPRIF